MDWFAIAHHLLGCSTVIEPSPLGGVLMVLVEVYRASSLAAPLVVPLAFQDPHTISEAGILISPRCQL
jgi:hypothetical protein